MLVSEMMNTHIVSVTPEESCALAARLLHRHNVGSLPVCGMDGKLRGIVTDRDIVLRCVAAENDPKTTPVKDIMTRGVHSVTPADDVRQATRLMASEQIRRLPVVDGAGKVVGMLALGDMARSHACDMEAAKALCDISAGVRHMGT